jgi:hypothetical protein
MSPLDVSGAVPVASAEELDRREPSRMGRRLATWIPPRG